ncbi:uncharacterized protein GIQ15_03362 [Arthroderma uncinatum]|uniref:uncharacterized protein n=1 Tax=Arthroderma uncinatum TaxID=74035 RepID=UPI00144AD824|nr:uncharacterized protein GIQ15_03362 [Arthroderma uncinatum]KAF3484038.1 hypothetical protein GIQ15_03362 [Arthroderma uncinatum]
MTMVLEHGHRQYGGMGYDGGVYQSHVQSNPPQFNDAWSAQPASHPPPPAYPSSMSSTNPIKREEIQRPLPPALSMPYSSVPVSAPSMVPNGSYPAVTYGGSELLVMPQDMPRTSLEQQQSSTTASPIHSFPPTSYGSLESQPHSQGPPPSTFGDALDASRGMVALSQDLTPRGIYPPRASRGSADSYGFPSAHSSASSISSGNNYPYYSASVVSVDSSVTDYSSTTSESYDGMASRTLPRPSALIGAMPPGPQSMMGQFSSKVPANTQKKHKCKICDKRFTRPSSLQTHMYSHTGEKPYACDVEGCGRHFSVVSNLRRHKKVHKGEKDSGSPEEEE